MWLDGVVTDIDGKPVRGAVVEIWQCDQQATIIPVTVVGPIPHSRGLGGSAWARGRVSLPHDPTGRLFRTHAAHPRESEAARRELLTTQLYVDGDSHNERDFLWRSLDPAQRAALTVPSSPARTD